MSAKGLDLRNNKAGGGTSNYNELSNKPQLNGVTLSGNKASSQLGLASKVAKETSQPDGGMAPNTYYELGELSGTVTFSLAAATDNTIVNVYDWQFDTGATAPTITWPSGLLWVGGSAPTIDANKRYEINIVNNMATFVSAALS